MSAIVDNLHHKPEHIKESVWLAFVMWAVKNYIPADDPTADWGDIDPWFNAWMSGYNVGYFDRGQDGKTS